MDEVKEYLNQASELVEKAKKKITEKSPDLYRAELLICREIIAYINDILSGLEYDEQNSTV